MELIQELTDQGNSVMVIEHNMEVVKCADHIIDLGPDGGRDGGRIVAEGTPEEERNRQIPEKDPEEQISL